MLPYCTSDASYTWMCLRGVVLGTLSLGTVVFCLYAIYTMLPACLNLSQYRPHMALIVLAALEMTCVLLRCAWVDEPKLMIAAKYCRGIQVSISCWLYGQMACEFSSKKSLVFGLLVPLLVAVAVLMTVDVIIMLNDPYVDCHHASWLVMSLASSTLAGTVTNMISSVLQLSYDLYITYVVGDEPCAKIFYDDNDGAIEQIVRLGLALATFVYPEWVTVYVFFWSARHTFATHHLDVPDIAADDELLARSRLLTDDSHTVDAAYYQHMLDYDTLAGGIQHHQPFLQRDQVKR
ncbi:hypothetical protein DYB32_009690 [Aphanomyces invadans]|uniref:Uncharacterized protein n=1 Tax=Aphanomyces invadans TaxID=157072 RepID=A0A3R6Z3S7_9STRA|nr:hypothetical protein DYB32_009690 [Aphanomyces invadans]